MVLPTITPTRASGTPTAFQAWTCCAQPAGMVTHPDQLAPVQNWLPAIVPGTVAEALAGAGQWHLGAAHDFDACDWWYRTTFPHADGACRLRLDGLATLAEIWLNGEKLLSTDNMFRGYQLDITSRVRPQNELVLGFRALAEDLKLKRPRPRWKTNLVSHQQLRWRRTSLLGHIPGWSPPVGTVGPWRNIYLETSPITLIDWRLTTRLEGANGVVCLRARLRSPAPIVHCQMTVDGQHATVQIAREDQDWLLHCELPVPNPALWWPHTHGSQPLARCRVVLSTSAGEYAIDGGKIGFRQLEMSGDDAFGISINGVAIYCRGACWTVSDCVRPGATEGLERDLRLARDAGINMLRVIGTMVYESDKFYELCDELGILVWQDFMFANMDYPVDDPVFADNIEGEARQQLARLAAHPALVIFCGNSEIEQQAAMLGMPRELWRNPWFATQLPALCAEYAPGTYYVPSTPTGGALPFHVGEGIAHYYGVGAYRRLPAELRQAGVKFTPECLGFSQLPEPATAYLVTEGAAPVLHQPRWKERVPRDTGSGWDFEDVRDFYLQHLFGAGPAKLRSFDMPRYLQLSRVVPGAMMSEVFAEWRGSHSPNRGALVWFFKDLWPGAGWGIVDSLGMPKAGYYYLKRCWQTRQLTITNENLDGLHFHVINETCETLKGFVEVLLLQDGHIVSARGETACNVAARGRQTWTADSILGGFYDVNYAYRFGPPQHDVLVATLFDDQHQALSEAFHFVAPRVPAFVADVKLEATAIRTAAGPYDVHLRTDHFLEAVRFEAKGFLPDDNYFNLVPGRSKTVTFTALAGQETRFRASMEALNLRTPVSISLT